MSMTTLRPWMSEFLLAQQNALGALGAQAASTLFEAAPGRYVKEKAA